MSRREPEQETKTEWRLWAIVIGLVLVVAYVIAFIVENSHQVSIHWVFGTTQGSLIFVILVSLGIGLLVGLLLPPLYRRRRRRRSLKEAAKRPGEPPDAVGDLGGGREAEGKPR